MLALHGPRAVQLRLLLPGARRVVDQEIRSRIDWARQDVRARRDLDEVLTRVEKSLPRIGAARRLDRPGLDRRSFEARATVPADPL